jgi:CubicO group peptidase (beta-lactamase class C family)
MVLPRSSRGLLSLSLTCTAWLGCGVRDAAADVTSPGAHAALVSDLRQILDEGRGRALAGVVVQDGAVVWQGGIGTADVARATPATERTIFQLASAGKILTGLALCDLAVAGRIQLDAEVLRLAPQLPIDNPFPDHPLRVRHLLEHTSGIQEIIPRWYDERREPVLPVLDLVGRTLRRVRAKWPPGDRNVYSNFNYIAAAHLIEVVTGQPFDDYIAARVFRPLGMSGATYRLFADDRPEVARGYSAGSTVPVAPTMGAYRVAAGMAASAEDLGKLLAFILSEGEHRGRQLIPREAFRSLERLETGPAGREGLMLGHAAGAVAREMRGYRFFGHNGIVDGFSASLFYSREARLGFALLSNAHPLPRGPSLSALRGAVLDHFLPEPGPGIELHAVESPGELAGFYQLASSRFAQLAGFDRLLRNVWLDEEDVRTMPGGTLARDGQGRPFLFRPPTGYYERASAGMFWLRAATLGLAALACLTIPVQITMALRSGRSPAMVGALATFLLALGAVAWALFNLRTSEAALRLNLWSGMLFAGTLALHLAANVAAVLGLLLLRRSRGAWDWAMAAAAVGAAVVANALAVWGLVGVKMWDGGRSVLFSWG